MCTDVCFCVSQRVCMLSNMCLYEARKTLTVVCTSCFSWRDTAHTNQKVAQTHMHTVHLHTHTYSKHKRTMNEIGKDIRVSCAFFNPFLLCFLIYSSKKSPVVFPIVRILIYQWFPNYGTHTISNA